MEVRVKLFAGIREAVGASEVRRSCREGTTVGELWQQFQREVPGLPPQGRIALAVNREYVTPDTELHDGDEVAFIPPVSGGSG
jgi:molybdopterin converting factor subunit 1